MAPPFSSRLLSPSLALLAVLFVVVGLLVVWPEPWDDARPLVTLERASSSPRQAFDAPLAGVDGLAQPLSVTPLLEDGVPRGLVLGPVHAGSLFARMGLQEGDVLLSFHDLGALDAPQWVAHVERAGRPLRVEYAAAHDAPERHASARARSAPLSPSPFSRRAADLGED